MRNSAFLLLLKNNPEKCLKESTSEKFSQDCGFSHFVLTHSVPFIFFLWSYVSRCVFHQMGVSIVMGVPPNGWFSRDDPIYKWIIWGYPQSSSISSFFFWSKPSSYGGTPIFRAGNLHICGQVTDPDFPEGPALPVVTEPLWCTGDKALLLQARCCESGKMEVDIDWYGNEITNI